MPRYRIRPSAWKGNSANFRFTEFSQVRVAPVQRPCASLAEIGFLEGYYLTFPRLPHNTHRTRLAPPRPLADWTGAMPCSLNFSCTEFSGVAAGLVSHHTNLVT